MAIPENRPPLTPEEIRAKLEEANAWFDTIDEFLSTDGSFDVADFKKWGLERLDKLRKEVT